MHQEECHTKLCENQNSKKKPSSKEKKFNKGKILTICKTINISFCVKRKNLCLYSCVLNSKYIVVLKAF